MLDLFKTFDAEEESRATKMVPREEVLFFRSCAKIRGYFRSPIFSSFSPYRKFIPVPIPCTLPHSHPGHESLKSLFLLFNEKFYHLFWPILTKLFEICWKSQQKRSLFLPRLWGYFWRLTIYFRIQPGFSSKNSLLGCPNILIFIYFDFLLSKILCYDSPELLHNSA